MTEQKRTKSKQGEQYAPASSLEAKPIHGRAPACSSLRAPSDCRESPPHELGHLRVSHSTAVSAAGQPGLCLWLFISPWESLASDGGAQARSPAFSVRLDVVGIFLLHFYYYQHFLYTVRLPVDETRDPPGDTSSPVGLHRLGMQVSVENSNGLLPGLHLPAGAKHIAARTYTNPFSVVGLANCLILPVKREALGTILISSNCNQMSGRGKIGPVSAYVQKNSGIC